MSRISQRFSGRKLLIPYIMGGLPDGPTCVLIARTFADLGCPVIEIGIPYSDPLADGPTIQRASEAALAAGVNTDMVLEMIKGITAEVDISPILMVYYNSIYRYGLDRFAEAARNAGVEGVIVPDLTVEESGDWLQSAEAAGIDTVFLTAPTSSDARLTKIVARSKGFVYAVSLTGVTGARRALPDYLKSFVDRVKLRTELPIAVGFGISQPDQAREVAALADGVIVGSAIVDLIEKTPKSDLPTKIHDFGAGLLAAIQSEER